MKRRIILIVHNVRSCHNVGSLLRTAEGLGVEKMYLTGYTPFPQQTNDNRLPHISQKVDKQIHKTALDAENMIPWEACDDIHLILQLLRNEGFQICALEQHDKAISLPNYNPPPCVALVVGREVEGIEKAVLRQVDNIIEIPMRGKKESFNVVQAAAMALYHMRFMS